MNASTSRRRGRSLPLLAAGILVAGLLVVAVSPAEAAPRTYYANVSTTSYKPFCQFRPRLQLADRRRSEGCFESNGDRFALVDTKADGKGVAILWKYGKRKRGICRNARGKADEDQTWPTCRFDGVIPEGRRITAWLSTCDATPERSCRKWSHWRKQSPDLKRVYRTTRPEDGG